MKLEDLSWDWHPDADDVLLEVDGCTVSVLVRGRNAWHSTWVMHWFRNSHLFTDSTSARRGAEPLRERGNVFYVQDRPAVVLTGVASRIAIFDGFGEEPFRHFVGLTEDVVTTPYGSYRKGVFPGVTLREAVEQFRPRSDCWGSIGGCGNAVQFATVPDDAELMPLRGSDLVHETSYAQGSGYYLGWTSKRTSVKTTSVRRQGDSWQDLLSRLDDVEGTLADRLRSRFAHSPDPARSRAALRERYDAHVHRLQQEVAEAEADYEVASAAADESLDSLYEAETFAEDPWASVRAADTSAAVRRARDRAKNANVLLAQAEVFHTVAQEAAKAVWARMLDARRRLAELETL